MKNIKASALALSLLTGIASASDVVVGKETVDTKVTSTTKLHTETPIISTTGTSVQIPVTPVVSTTSTPVTVPVQGSAPLSHKIDVAANSLNAYIPASNAGKAALVSAIIVGGGLAYMNWNEIKALANRLWIKIQRNPGTTAATVAGLVATALMYRAGYFNATIAKVKSWFAVKADVVAAKVDQQKDLSEVKKNVDNAIKNVDIKAHKEEESKIINAEINVVNAKLEDEKAELYAKYQKQVAALETQATVKRAKLKGEEIKHNAALDAQKPVNA